MAFRSPRRAAQKRGVRPWLSATSMVEVEMASSSANAVPMIPSTDLWIRLNWRSSRPPSS